jgi:hypothetical protein
MCWRATLSQCRRARSTTTIPISSARSWTPLIRSLPNYANGSPTSSSWILARSRGGLHHFERLLVRYDCRHEIPEAFLAIGCCLIRFRRLQKSL